MVSPLSTGRQNYEFGGIPLKIIYIFHLTTSMWACVYCFKIEISDIRCIHLLKISLSTVWFWDLCVLCMYTHTYMYHSYIIFHCMNVLQFILSLIERTSFPPLLHIILQWPAVYIFLVHLIKDPLRPAILKPLSLMTSLLSKKMLGNPNSFCLCEL